MASQTHPSSVTRFAEFELDGVSGELRKAGVSLRIQPQPFRVLQLLVERPGQIVTREEIQRCLWGDNTFVDYERGINFCVNHIRAVLGDDAEQPRYIETLTRRGYRFIAAVSSSASRDTKSLAEDAVVPVERLGYWPGDPKGDRPSGLGKAAARSTTPVPVTSIKWGRVAVLIFTAVAAVVITGYALFRWTAQKRGTDFQNLRITQLVKSGNVEGVAISPDGSYVVYSQSDSNGTGLRLRHVASGSEVQILPSDEVYFWGVTVSPDGNSIYFVRTRKEISSFKDLYSIPVLGGPAQLLARDIDSPVSFSPDGRQFVYTTGMPNDTNDMHIANADGSRNRVLATIQGTSPNVQTGSAWSPDGRTIVVSLMLMGKGAGFVLDAVSAIDGSVREIFHHDQEIGKPVWLPGENTVLAMLKDTNGLGQLWAISISEGEMRRVTNDLADWGLDIDATHDAMTLAAVQTSVTSNIWVARKADLSNALQITHRESPVASAVGVPNHKILASASGKPWIMGADGTQEAPFSTLDNVVGPVMCGNFVVAASYSSGPAEAAQTDGVGLKPTKLAHWSLRLLREPAYQFGPADVVRVDLDGLNPFRLASGFVYSPSCSPDGKFVFYVLTTSPQRILRVPIQGGEPTEIGTIPGPSVRGTMRVSPDGKFLAFPFDQDSPTLATKLAVVPVSPGPGVRIFDVSTGISAEGCLRWSPDGRGLQYLLTQADVTNIWEQPVVGGLPRQITNFTSGHIFDFNWTADGKQLLLSRGEIRNDVVLVSNLR
jgi:DNA-binding winged helix-turn-helix (wHTH) protein/Tol biopolymer transport system component